MNRLLQAFFADALRRCERLRENLQVLRESSASNSDDARRRSALMEIFRQLHTLKGSAAAFELEAVSRLAHEIEHFVEIALSRADAETAIFDECFAELENSLRAAQNTENFELSLEKIERWRESCLAARTVENRETPILPAEYFNRLKNHEQLRLQIALSQNASVYLLEMNLPTQSFAENFRQLHAQLSKRCEIVATLPDAETRRDGKIKMHLICAATETQTADMGHNFSARFDCRIISTFQRRSVEDVQPKKPKRKSIDTARVRLSDVWATPLASAIHAARVAGKSVRFETRGEEIEISGELAETCETIFLHLLRNAVFHGIETPDARLRAGKDENGVVFVEATREENRLQLKISDDGGGIDAEKMWEIGVERGIFDREKPFDRAAAERLIFRPGFSTAAAVSFEAGRGIGLDAVASAIEKAAGDLKVLSEPGRGTAFLIRLPAF